MENVKERKFNKKWLLPIIVVIVVLGVCLWYFLYQKPHVQAFTNYKAAISDYNDILTNYNAEATSYNEMVSAITSANEDFDISISSAENALASNNTPFDETTREELSASIDTAKTSKIDAPAELETKEQLSISDSDKKLKTSELTIKAEELQSEIEELESKIPTIQSNTSALSVPDYTSVISDMEAKQSAFEDSIAILKQVTNPEESFVLSKLKEIPTITDMQAVTEDHDPNGNLNKAGGYTSTVYFTITLIDPSTVAGNDIVEKGTDAGGSIEVYSTVEDAEKRNTYLAAFDGSILSTGSHSVLGTIVIRISDQLTASQQQSLEQEIINKFTEL